MGVTVSKALRTVLNAGSGHTDRAYERFPEQRWIHVRLDADPAAEPDLVADVRHIPLDNESVDAVWCSHTIEHLPEMEALEALREFCRVLRPLGELHVRVPDLTAVAKAIVDGGATGTLYEADCGPVRPLDVLYGFQPYVRQSQLYAHQTGFTAQSLADHLMMAGFAGEVTEHPDLYELRAEAHKP